MDNQYKKAYDEIMRHEFQTWEGAEGKITTQFKIALTELSKEAIAKEDYVLAKMLLEEALSYPLNLGEGRLEGTKDNNIYYLLGVVSEKLNNSSFAKECYEKATVGASEPAGMMYYYDQPADMILYQGLAKQKIGEQTEANSRFYKLIDYAEQHIRDTFKMDYFAVSMPDFAIFDEDMNEKNKAHCYYLLGLGKLGLNDKVAAAHNFNKALEIDPNHQNAAIYLKMTNN